MNNANNIDDDQNRSYIDLQYLMFDASRMHIIITSRNSTIKKMIALKTIEMTNMKFSKTIELFRRYVKIQNSKSNVTTKVNQIVKKLKCLILIIILIESYVFVTSRLSFDIKKYLFEYRQRRKKLFRRRFQQQIHRYEKIVLNT